MLVYARSVSMERVWRVGEPETELPTKKTILIPNQLLDKKVLSLVDWDDYGKLWWPFKVFYASIIEYRSRIFRITYCVDRKGSWCFVNHRQVFESKHITVNGYMWDYMTTNDIVNYMVKKHINLEDHLISTWHET